MDTNAVKPVPFSFSRNTEHLHQVENAGWEIMQACVKLGGTISGEHGIGLEKLNAMHMIFSDDDFKTQRALLKAFDSENKLNPGKDLLGGTKKFRIGDRVMQIKNNYDKDVFNGDIGIIDDLDEEDEGKEDRRG